MVTRNEMYPDVPEPDPDYEDEVDSSTNVKPSELHVETQDGKPVLIRERNPSVTSNPETNESELIKPKKLTNPCIESSTRMALHKELLLNYKRGIDILQKPELDKDQEVMKTISEKNENNESELSKIQKKIFKLSKGPLMVEKLNTKMAALDSMTELTKILEEWNRDHTSLGLNPVSALNRLSEIIEKETEAYFKMDPDPFDDRHPGRANPTCVLGHLMKALFKNEDFMNMVVSNYVMSSRDQTVLHTAACRLLLDVLPGLETSVVFQETEGIVQRLFQWAESADEPLRSYATGLLAGAMELQDIATNFKDQNAKMVPLMLKRLRELKSQLESEGSETRTDDDKRHFYMFSKGKEKSQDSGGGGLMKTKTSPLKHQTNVKNNHEETEAENKPKVSKDSENKTGVTEKLTSITENETGIFENNCGVLSDSKKVMEVGTSKETEEIAKVDATPKDEFKKPRTDDEPNNEGHAEGRKQSYKRSLSPSYYSEDLYRFKRSRTREDSLTEFSNSSWAEIEPYVIGSYCLQPLSTAMKQRLILHTAFENNALELIFYYINLKENRDVRLAFESLKVCLLPDHVLSEMVSYILWLMECSHDSSRCHAAMFFGQAFPFRVILDLFDQKDGLRRLFNVISTSELLNVDSTRDNLNEDQIFTMRQSARHVCTALKKYFEAHLSRKVEEIRRSHSRSDGGSPVHETPAYKAIKLTPEVIQENIELIMDLMPVTFKWAPESTFHNLGGIGLICQLVAMAPEWNNYSGKAETIKNALDVLNTCTVTPKSQIALLDSVPLPDNLSTPAVSVLIGLAEGEIISDPEVQKSALNVIINCVCGPMERYGGGYGRYTSSVSRKRINFKVGEDILSRMWNGVRVNNGIMVLLKLLSALVGLSRSETVRQIISKLPLFNNGQLQILMKEPVLQDKRQEHVKFCRYANELIERVSGKHSNANWDASLEEIRRADIVAQTKIMFQERELLKLIQSHLLSKGFVESAAALQKEANLPQCTSPPLIHPASPHIYSTPHTPKLGRQTSVPGTSVTSSVSAPNVFISHHYRDSQKDSPISSSTPGTPGPIRFTIGRHANSPPTNGVHSKATSQRCKFLKESSVTSPAWRSKGVLNKPQGDMTLDKIVTEYLRKQHALCRNPILPRYGGIDGASANRKFVYSRFRPIRTYKDNDEDGYSCCAFSACEQYLLLGTYSGDLKMINLNSGEEAGTYTCHSAPISHLQPTRDGNLILTSYSGWGNSNGSALWKFVDVLDSRYNLDEDYVEFSKQTQDRIIGTKEETAHIYDVATGQQLLKLYDADKANNYRDNRATFHPTDDLVLNDGVLWDARSGKSIHKFDKFNSFVSGIFHPMGLELIINSEWDLRTYHLLHTVPSLDQCQIRFNNSGDVIYAIHIDEDLELEEDKVRSPYGSTFRTFDATDYSSIATIDNQQYTDTTTEEFVCKLYEVGKLKDAEDDQLCQVKDTANCIFMVLYNYTKVKQENVEILKQSSIY
ncbi:hypothetical protein KUTeg_021037 [Tegillarca granosa]|uniref:LisH domain-containing protein n=1 Tax=Tegillarca granosa TaxID=220873 RepID=A0ABQ9EEW4_TEGGR|nr:hypothetical protein KUTeg_021037 [Tegillarca granosa]